LDVLSTAVVLSADCCVSFIEGFLPYKSSESHGAYGSILLMVLQIRFVPRIACSVRP
jgi:hypothetical protein